MRLRLSPKECGVHGLKKRRAAPGVSPSSPHSIRAGRSPDAEDAEEAGDFFGSAAFNLLIQWWSAETPTESPSEASSWVGIRSWLWAAVFGRSPILRLKSEQKSYIVIL